MNLEKMQMNEVADLLFALSKKQVDPKDTELLKKIAARVSRRKPVRKAQSVARRCTPELRGEIRTFAKRNPNMTYAEIARRFDVNPGRVSEAMAGKRVLA